MAANLETYAGTSSYLYKQNRTRDHCVIGQDSFYITIRIALLILVLLLTTFALIGLPKPIISFCQKVHEMPDFVYFMVAIVIESVLLWVFFICNATIGFLKHLPEANTEADVKLHYAIFIISINAYPVIAFFYVWWTFKKSKLKNILITSECKKPIISLIYYNSGFTAIICSVQFLIFHGAYIFISMTIVSWLVILLCICLYIGNALLILFFITYTLKSVHTKSCPCSHHQGFTIYVLISLSIFAFCIFVTFTYINESGNFPVIVKSITSLAGFIFGLQKAVKLYNKISRKSSTVCKDQNNDIA